MKFKNLFIILSLFKALICGVSPITSTYDDANNYVTGMGNRPVLVGNDDQAIVVDSFTSASNAKRINGHSDIITVNNNGDYYSNYNVYGISYCQFTNTTHTYDIQNNTVTVNGGLYTVYLMSGDNCNVSGNTLNSSYFDNIEDDDVTQSGNSTVCIVDGTGNTIGPNP